MKFFSLFQKRLWHRFALPLQEIFTQLANPVTFFPKKGAHLYSLHKKLEATRPFKRQQPTLLSSFEEWSCPVLEQVTLDGDLVEPGSFLAV